MKYPVKIIGLIYIFFLVLSSSCAKLIQDTFPYFEPVPALNCILSAGNTISLQLSLAEKIDTGSLHMINQADVRLFLNGTEAETLNTVEDGIFISGLTAEPGIAYSFQVSVPGYDALFATDTVPALIPLTITAYNPFSRLDEYAVTMERISFSFEDDPASADFYEVTIWNRNDDNTYREYAFNENSPILLNEGLEPYSTGTLLFSDELFDGPTVNMELEFSGEYLDCYNGNNCHVQVEEHTVIVELRHVSREYYRFKKSFYLYDNSLYSNFVEGATSVYPLYSNIENGYGIMAAYSSYIDSVAVAAETIYINSL